MINFSKMNLADTLFQLFSIALVILFIVLVISLIRFLLKSSDTMNKRKMIIAK